MTRKLTVTDADLAAARAAVIDQLEGENVFAAFPKSYQDDLVRRQAELDVLTVSVNGLESADKAARAYYDDNQNQFATACVSHILVDTEEQALALRDRIVAGEDFATVAKAESKDTASAEKGGDVGCDITQATGFVPEFLLAVFAQPVGEVGAPVKTEFGYHLIKVTSRNVPPYEQVAAKARRQVTESGQDKVLSVLEEAVQGSKIEVNPKYGSFRKTGNSPGVVPPQSNAPTTAQPRSALPANQARDRRRRPRSGADGSGGRGRDSVPPAPISSPPPPPSAIGRISRRFLRTTRHPAAAAVEPAVSFDSVYESATSLDDVYAGIVDTLVEAASVEAAEGAEVLYAVPGSPLVAERTVELLLADERVDVELVPGCRSPTWRGPACVSTRWRPACAWSTATGSRSRRPASGVRCWWPSATPATSCRRSSCRSTGAPPPEVVVLSRLGLPDESVRTVAWDDLDREVEPDHLTSLYVPVLAAPVAGEVARFAELVRTLRERCPWDREQTHATLTRHLLEETYEVLEAINSLNPGGELEWPVSTWPAGQTTTATATSRRSWATCSSRWCSTPPWPPRRAGSPSPTWPGASTTSSSTAIRTCSARCRPTPPARSCRTGSASSRPRRGERA